MKDLLIFTTEDASGGRVRFAIFYYDILAFHETRRKSNIEDVGTMLVHRLGEDEPQQTQVFETFEQVQTMLLEARGA